MAHVCPCIHDLFGELYYIRRFPSKRGVTQLIQVIRSRLSIETYDDLGILIFLRTPDTYEWFWSLNGWFSYNQWTNHDPLWSMVKLNGWFSYKSGWSSPYEYGLIISINWGLPNEWWDEHTICFWRWHMMGVSVCLNTSNLCGENHEPLDDRGYNRDIVRQTHRPTFWDGSTYRFFFSRPLVWLGWLQPNKTDIMCPRKSW